MRATNLAAYSHQDLPFERLVEVLNPARSLARHPLFQVMLAFQNNADANLELPGLKTSVEPVDIATVKFDLALDLIEKRAPDGTPQGISGVLEYNTDLFERATVEAMAGRLIRLLEAAVADPDQAIGRLDILSAEERHTHPAHLERYGARDPARHPAGAVRGPGRQDPRCYRGGVRG